jgi:hypothetical protein
MMAKTRHRSFDHLVSAGEERLRPRASPRATRRGYRVSGGAHASEPRPESSEGFIDDAATYTIQFCCSDPTFQSSALVWVGWGVVNPGGVNFETTSWI